MNFLMIGGIFTLLRIGVHQHITMPEPVSAFNRRKKGRFTTTYFLSYIVAVQIRIFQKGHHLPLNI